MSVEGCGAIGYKVRQVSDSRERVVKKAHATIALAVVFVATSAVAYVLPGFSILRRMVERRNDLRLTTLQVTGTATFPQTDRGEAALALGVPPPERALQGEATIALKLPGRCRMEVRVPEGGASATVQAHGKRRIEGTEIAAVSAALAQVCSVVALTGAEAQSRQALDRYLRSLGIEVQTTSLGRFDGRIAYVLGKRAEGSAQFWIYKDSFQPARVLFADERGTRWDVQFKDFGSPVGGDAFPRQIEVKRGGDLLMRFTALETRTGPKLADQLF